MKKQSPKPRIRQSMVGTFFHQITAEKTLGWQGVIIGNPRPGWYLVQLFEWGMGEPNVQRLVRFEDMKDWLFYPDAETMDFSWQHGVARKYQPWLKEAEALCKEGRGGRAAIESTHDSGRAA